MVDKVEIKREGWQRKGLLTDREKQHLKSNTINPKIRTKLYRKLDKRIESFHKDLDLMIQSPHLDAWRIKNSALIFHNFNDLIQKYQKLGMITRRLYMDPIKYDWKGKKRIFWLDQSKQYENEYNIGKVWSRVVKPDFALRKIRRYIKDDTVLDKLRKIVELNKLPNNKGSALTLGQISIILTQ